jgi:hypothetical protein
MIVGRAEELTQLERLLAELRAQRGRALVLGLVWLPVGVVAGDVVGVRPERI